MKRIIQLLEFIFIVSCLYSQTPQLGLKIISVNSNKENIKLDVEIINYSNQEIVVLNQNVKQICSSLMHIRFINIKNNRTHELFPFTSIADLDQIELNSKNSLFVNSNDKVIIKYSFAKKNITPYLKKKNTYKVIVGWYFKSVYIKTDFKNYFNDDVESNYVLFKNN